MKKTISLNHKLIKQAYAFVDAHALIPYGSSIVIGFSGGSDSVFLLHFLKLLQPQRSLTLYAAHLNHEWRGAEADADATFCQAMAAELDITYIQTRMSELSPRPLYEGSHEAQGRAARRQFLTEAQQKVGAQFIALAHHADDQQETFFIRLIRGASLTGLIGMAPKTVSYIRPLLYIHKKEILSFLEEFGISYRMDSSNMESDYLRNRIRANVLPALKAADERFDNSFQHTLTRLQEAEDFLRQITTTTFNQIAFVDAEHHYIVDQNAFKALHPVLQERILIYWLCIEKAPFPPSYGFLREMIRFIESSQGGTHEIHHAWSLIKQTNKLSIIYH